MTQYRFRDDPPAHPGRWHLIEGDCVERLRSLPDNYVRCTVTSQPYLGQRTYGVEGEYGREETIEDHVERMVSVASEILRVTVSDGLLFWNLRDSFNGSGGPGGDHRNPDGSYRITARTGIRTDEVPRKAQCLIPERLRIAFQRIGWIPRSRIVWDKRDAFSAAPDRLSYSYEEILLFAKSERHWFDVDAVMHVCPGRPPARLRDVWEFPAGRQPEVLVDGETRRATASFPLLLPEICINLASEPGDIVLDPFCGFGTTVLAAVKWGRHAVGIDLNDKDLAAARARLAEAGFGARELGTLPIATNYNGLPLVERMES